MLGRVVLVAALFLGAGLAGCIGAAEDDAVVPQADNKSTGTIEPGNASAPDGRGDISAFKETNKTEASGTGSMHHSHDYWKGETRKELHTADMWFIPLPVAPCRSGTYPSGDCYNPGTSIADIDIPAPTLVYEGTAYLEVLFDNLRADPVAEAPNPVVVMGFDYLTAADNAGEWREGSKAVTPGTPVIIPVAATEADMPHQQKSLWLFRIYTESATSVYFNFTVTAVKGNAIANWPPHPDLYADKTERLIFEGGVKTETRGWADYWVSGNDANWVNPERVISYGTDTVDVEVKLKSFTLNGLPNAVDPDYFYLDYHNASFLSKLGNGDLSGGRVTDPSTDGTTFKFSVPVDEYGMDTPYGEKSRWAFRFMARYSDDACPGPQSIMQGCQFIPYTIEYDMKIVAKGHSISQEGIKDLNEVEESGADANESAGR